MRRATLALAGLLVSCTALAGPPACPPSWPLRFTAREAELDSVALPAGDRYCAEDAGGYVSGPRRSDGSTLDAQLPEGSHWTVYGPPHSTPAPLPTPTARPTPGPGGPSRPPSSSPAPSASPGPSASPRPPDATVAPTPAASVLPNTATNAR